MKTCKQTHPGAFFDNGNVPCVCRRKTKTRQTNKYRLNSAVIAQVAWKSNGRTDSLGNRLGTLRIWFNSRKVYDYQDVTWSHFKYLVVWPSSGSFGSFYNRHIRGQFTSIKRYGYHVPHKLVSHNLKRMERIA